MDEEGGDVRIRPIAFSRISLIKLLVLSLLNKERGSFGVKTSENPTLLNAGTILVP